MKADEAAFLAAIQEDQRSHALAHRTLPRYIADRLGIHEKRAEYIYEKWSRKGWYEWGVSARTGWLTDEGMAVSPVPQKEAASP